MEVFGELFEKLDQAIHYNVDLQPIAENKYPEKFLPAICFSVKNVTSVQVNCGLSQATFGMCYAWSLHRSSFNLFWYFWTWSWFYKFRACTNLFSEWESLELENLITFNVLQNEANQFI